MKKCTVWLNWTKQHRKLPCVECGIADVIISDALVSTVVCFDIAIDEFGCRLFDIFVSDFFGPTINFSSQRFESKTVSDSEMILLFNYFFPSNCNYAISSG